jgi:hypothetical protein
MYADNYVGNENFVSSVVHVLYDAGGSAWNTDASVFVSTHSQAQSSGAVITPRTSGLVQANTHGAHTTHTPHTPQMDPSIQTLAQTLLKDSIDANSLDSADIAPTQSSQAGMSVPLSTLSTSSKQQQQQQPTNTLASSKVRMNPHQQGLHQQQQPSAKQSNTSTPQSMKQANTQPSTQTTMTGNGVYLCITGCRGSGKAATMSKLAEILFEMESSRGKHANSQHIYKQTLTPHTPHTQQGRSWSICTHRPRFAPSSFASAASRVTVCPCTRSCAVCAHTSFSL